MTAHRRTFSTLLTALLVGLIAGCTPSTYEPSSSGNSPNSTSASGDESSPDIGPEPESESHPPTGQPSSPPSSAPSENASTPPPIDSSSPPSQTDASSPAVSPDPEPDTGVGSGAPATVTPTVVYAGVGPDLTITVNGFVPGIVEEGGTCTAALVGAGTESTASSPAVPDASTTWCEELVMDRPEGDSADWRIVLTYSSPTHQGSSTPTAVSAP